MASLSWLSCRLYRCVSRLNATPVPRISGRRAFFIPARGDFIPVRRLHRSARLRQGEKPLAWSKTRTPEQLLTELDKADALMLRKSHETGFLSWFRNGLLATGIGVIAFVQSDVGREAGYAFFILGGACMSFGSASYLVSLLSLRRIMLMSLPTVLLHTTVVSSAALLWLCAVSLYIGRLEVEIIREEDEEDDGSDEGGECAECKARRDRQHTNDEGQKK